MTAKPIRVLVADDDVQILQDYESLLKRTQCSDSTARLRRLGSALFDDPVEVSEYPLIQTTCCRQGSEAVRLASQAIDKCVPFDVIILDIRMPPGISGVEAARRIRACDPNVPIIFITGYTDVCEDDIFKRVPPPEKLNYFTKPVRFDDLVSTIEEVAT